MDFNLIDIIIFSLLIIFMLKGYRMGLIKQITAIVAVIIGVYIAGEQYNVFAVFITKKFELNLKIAQVISFAMIIAIVSLIVNYIGYIFSQMADFLFLSLVDNIGGGLFGVVKGYLIIYIILLIVTKIPLDFLQEQLRQSYFAPEILELNSFLEGKIKYFYQ